MMAKRKVIGLGAGGHARVIIEILHLDPHYEVAGLLDPAPELQGSAFFGVPVIGEDARLPELYELGMKHFFIGLGGAGNTRPRQRLYELACSYGLQPVNVVHPSAMLSPSAKIGPGFTAMIYSVVNSCATVGENVILNTGAIVEHDCAIGNHVHIATGARLASTVQVGDRVHIGAGAIIRQCINIGTGAIVGAGAVVVKNVQPHTVVVGNPARVLRKQEK
jgi:UDP-perosamine 4-acetyltransferase